MRKNYYKISKMSPSKYKCEYVIALRYKYPLHNVPPLSINYLNWWRFQAYACWTYFWNIWIYGYMEYMEG